MARSRASSVLRAVCLVVIAGAWVGCGSSDPGLPRCVEPSDCRWPAPCEVAEGATCDEGGVCHYLPKVCDTAPAPSCSPDDAVYRVYGSAGTCASDGSCVYPTFDVACASCGTNCEGTCDGVECEDLQGGCRASGRCVPGAPATCFYEVAEAESACDDEDPCTYGERCDAEGRCVGSTVSCVDGPGACGVRRACNGTASCTETYPTSTTACDDGNAGTYGDHCDGAGVCVGFPINCTSEPGPCGLRRTATGTASCTESYPDASTACNDGNVGTSGDHCDGAGACVGTAVTCSDDPGVCGARRSANGTASCTVTYAGTSTTCDDGNLGTYGDHCDGAGACVGTAITCTDDPGTCGARRTANGTASCTVTYPSTSATCDDGNLCTYNDRCDGSGRCAGTAITCANDASTCGLRRSCNGTATCTTSYPTSSTACSDGNACTYGERCNGAGQCAGGTAYTCTGGACSASTCNGVGGCDTVPTNENTYCGSTSGCRVCRSGACVAGCPTGQRCTDYQGNYYCTI